MYGIMTEELVIREIRIDEAAYNYWRVNQIWL